MTETTARTYHTMESLRQMAQTDLRNVNRKDLVDINEVKISFRRSRTLIAISTRAW